jgi:GNAT superfamily N-acetyltransferase
LEGAFNGYIILTRHIWPDDVVVRRGAALASAPACAVNRDAYRRGIGTQLARHVLACARAWLKQVIRWAA